MRTDAGVKEDLVRLQDELGPVDDDHDVRRFGGVRNVVDFERVIRHVDKWFEAGRRLDGYAV